jgi:hypothetical protein
MKTPALIALLGVIAITINLFVESPYLKVMIHMSAGVTAWWFHNNKHSVTRLLLYALCGPIACLFAYADDLINSELTDAKSHEF